MRMSWAPRFFSSFITHRQNLAPSVCSFDANGGGQALEDALTEVRRARDLPEVRLERLMFTKQLESEPLIKSRLNAQSMVD